jgi:hypothetical protein
MGHLSSLLRVDDGTTCIADELLIASAYCFRKYRFCNLHKTPETLSPGLGHSHNPKLCNVWVHLLKSLSPAVVHTSKTRDCLTDCTRSVQFFVWECVISVSLPAVLLLLLQLLSEDAQQMVEGSLLTVPVDVLKEQIFDPIVNKIIAEATKMLEQRKADVLVLAGGFGSNPYLLKRLREECVQAGLVGMVIKPKAAYAAVMEGT